MVLRKKTSKAPTKRRFQYTKRSREDVKREASKNFGAFDSYFKADNVYKAKNGRNLIRILPPTWDLDPETGQTTARHYGYHVFLHYNVGANKSAYLCSARMNNEPCPICEEYAIEAAKPDPDKKFLEETRPKHRVLMYVIDRENESAGVLIYPMPTNLNADISGISEDAATKELFFVDDIEDGYDVSFLKTGEGRQTQYTSAQIARRSTPLHDDPKRVDEWLDYILDKPIPSLLQFYDYDYIKRMFSGEPVPKPSDEAEPEEEEPIEEEEEEGVEEEEEGAEEVEYEDEEEEEELEDPEPEEAPPTKRPSSRVKLNRLRKR